MKKIFYYKNALVALALTAIAPLSAQAEITVGVLVSETGPAASLGGPVKNTILMLGSTLGGEKVRYVMLDDATDPTRAAKNARKLISDEKVDVVIGPTTIPNAIAVNAVSGELKTPQLSLSPLPSEVWLKNPWFFSVAQPIPLMMKPLAEHMHKVGIKSVGYIGFSDSLGEQLLKGFEQFTTASGIKVVADERFGRTDQTASAQVLKAMSAHPDAMLFGATGTPGALPLLALHERGFKKPLYHNYATVTNDFLRIGGKAVEETISSTGPMIVAEQLPNTNPVKKVAEPFVKEYEAKYGAGSRNVNAGYAYDAYLLLNAAVPMAMKSAKPGTPEFRKALQEALEQSGGVVGTHGVYNMSPKDHNGMDDRAYVLVQVQNGKWTLIP